MFFKKIKTKNLKTVLDFRRQKKKVVIRVH